MFVVAFTLLSDLIIITSTCINKAIKCIIQNMGSNLTALWRTVYCVPPLVNSLAERVVSLRSAVHIESEVVQTPFLTPPQPSSPMRPEHRRVDQFKKEYKGVYHSKQGLIQNFFSWGDKALVLITTLGGLALIATSGGLALIATSGGLALIATSG